MADAFMGFKYANVMHQSTATISDPNSQYIPVPKNDYVTVRAIFVM